MRGCAFLLHISRCIPLVAARVKDALGANPLARLGARRDGHEVPFRVSKFQLGYAYRMPLTGPFNLALGGTASTFAKPKALDSAYGKNPMGFTLFAKLSLGH